MGVACQEVDRVCRKLEKFAKGKNSSISVAIAYAKKYIRPYYTRTLPVLVHTQVIAEILSKLRIMPLFRNAQLNLSGPLYVMTLLLGPDIKKLAIALYCYYSCTHQASILKIIAIESVGLEYL